MRALLIFWMRDIQYQRSQVRNMKLMSSKKLKIIRNEIHHNDHLKRY